MLAYLKQPGVAPIVLSAACIMMVTMGIRQSTGLLVSPINTASGLGIASISFALAIGQFMWGAAQPIAGAIADRYGPSRVLMTALLMLAIGCAATPLLYGSTWGLTLAMGFLMAVGSGGASFSVLMGAAAQKLPERVRGPASGFVNAGGSFGQFVFAPALQKMIQTAGWMNGLFALALVSLAALPLIRTLVGDKARDKGDGKTAHEVQNNETNAASANPSGGHGDSGNAALQTAPTQESLGTAIREAFRDRSYWLLHAGFFTCGFHIAFLITHLPGEIDLCGLPAAVASTSIAIIGLSNIAGSLLAGASLTRWLGKHVLFVMYGSRAVMIALYLALPKTEMTFYVFAIGLGLTWLATVPPTASIVGKLFGPRYLGTLFGLTVLSHQIGGFLGAWLGGLAIVKTGDYAWMWWADIALAAMAAGANLPIREEKVLRV